MSDIREFCPLWGEWEADTKLGEGSFGAVWRVWRRGFNNQVYYAAVKHISIPKDFQDVQRLVDEGFFSDQEAAARYYENLTGELVSEIDTMIRLQGYTNIVSYEDHKIIPKPDGIGYDVFLRMELLTPLREKMKLGMTTGDVVQLGKDIAAAIEVLNSYHLVHRDIKPQNIFINDTGNYKLGDYGTARVLEVGTMEMSHKGTYNYMAPEIYKNEKANSLVDIYSLGLVMYRLLNGNRLPFFPPTGEVRSSDSNEALMRRISGESFPPPVYADRELGEIVLKACAFRPEDRFQSAAEMISALEKYQRKAVKLSDYEPEDETLSASAQLQMASWSTHTNPPRESGRDSGGENRQSSDGGWVMIDAPAQTPPARGPQPPAQVPPAPAVRQFEQYPALPVQQEKKKTKIWIIPVAVAAVAAVAAAGVFFLRGSQKAGPAGLPTDTPAVLGNWGQGSPSEMGETPVPTVLSAGIDTAGPSDILTAESTLIPTEIPTAVPTAEPTQVPTSVPTAEPTQAPTAAPTAEPTQAPTAAPTAEPTQEPTAAPTAEPTQVPTAVPTAEPTQAPTSVPTEAPAAEPTLSGEETQEELISADEPGDSAGEDSALDEDPENFPLYGRTTEKKVNVRVRTDTSSKRVAYITNKGTLTEIIAREFDDSGEKWYKVRLENGKTGYVLAAVMDLQEAAEVARFPFLATTVSQKINLRTEADKSSRRVTYIKKKGTTVSVLDEVIGEDNKSWFKVQLESGDVGFARSDLFEVQSDTTATNDSVSGETKGDFTPVSVRLYRDQRSNIYAGPGTGFLRPANGKAWMNTNESAYVYGQENGWVLVQYPVGRNQWRFGYASLSIVEDAQNVPTLSFTRSTATVVKKCNMTDDPLHSKRKLLALKLGQTVTCLARMDSWVYVETETARGFVPADSLKSGSE